MRADSVNGFSGARAVFPFSYPGLKQIYFITGTDTGAGKTVLGCLLVSFLREQGVNAAALKPVCSGGREDARRIFSAMNGALPLDEINPWHFRAPIAPALAARRENKTIRLPQVLAQIRAMRKRFDVLIVEGAGGLLSPLGDDFNSRDLIRELRATPVVAAPNRLGVANHVLLTLEALPKKIRDRTRVVLMSSSQPDSSAATNATLLAKFFPAQRIFSLPWFGKRLSSPVDNPRARSILPGLLRD
ncbi:MAG TPA: dethiobiotin synthase [Verrucomicrobiae bacterium]|jgi:dethiobiotin synthetase